MADKIHKKELSGKLLTMKFMQRQQEQETRQRLEQEQVRVVTEAHWVIGPRSTDLPKPKFKVEYEPSFLQMNATVQANVGRTSFQHFNDSIEKSASKSVKDQKLDRELKRERQEAISDDEFVDRTKVLKAGKNGISGQGGSSSSKEKSNRRSLQTGGARAAPSAKKQKFMKPKE